LEWRSPCREGVPPRGKKGGGKMWGREKANHKGPGQGKWLAINKRNRKKNQGQRIEAGGKKKRSSWKEGGVEGKKPARPPWVPWG